MPWWSPRTIPSLSRAGHVRSSCWYSRTNATWPISEIRKQSWASVLGKHSWVFVRSTYCLTWEKPAESWSPAPQSILRTMKPRKRTSTTSRKCPKIVQSKWSRVVLLFQESLDMHKAKPKIKMHWSRTPTYKPLPSRTITTLSFLGQPTSLTWIMVLMI